jgi:hypothetical protein
VLIVDFSADAGRQTGSFSDLVPLLPSRYTVWAPHHDTWGDPTETDPAARRAEWLAGADRFGPDVVAVVGYCAGYGLAAAYADHLAGPKPPVLILLDPLPVLPQTLLYEYVEAVYQLASVLQPEVVGRAVEWAEERARQENDLLTLARHLTASYAGLAADGCRELGIETEFSEQLVGRLSGYLSYLVIASTAPPPRNSPALVLRSREPLSAALAEPYPDAQQLNISRADLLRSQEVADMVTRVLAAGGD